MSVRLRMCCGAVSLNFKRVDSLPGIPAEETSVRLVMAHLPDGKLGFELQRADGSGIRALNDLEARRLKNALASVAAIVGDKVAT